MAEKYFLTDRITKFNPSNAKYFYKEDQYYTLLNIARTDGLKIGHTNKQNLSIIGIMVDMIIRAYIMERTEVNER